MGELVVLSDYRKAKEPKELTYAEWVRFCLDPFNLLQTRPKPKPRK